MKRKDFLTKTALSIGAVSLLSCAEEISSTNKLDLQSVVPEKLKKGDTIALFAPAGAIFNAKHISKTEQVLTKLGYKVLKADSLYSQKGYFSASDENRLEEFHTLMANTNVKAIIAMRGGWGCARLLPNLNLDLIKKNPKIIMGYSDLTSLLNYITDHTGLVTYHGIMGYSTWNNFALSQFENHLVNDENEVVLSNPNTDTNFLKTVHSGETKGILCGGNLSVLVSNIGTDYEPIWKDKILFLEETHEEPYRIDKMLFQMKHADVFEQINGLVLGKFNDCLAEYPDESFTLEEVFTDYFDTFNKPMYRGAAFGHVVNKFILPIGKVAHLNADQQTITVL